MIAEGGPLPKMTWGVFAFIVGSIFALGGYVFSQETINKDNRDRIEKIEYREEIVHETLASIDKRLSHIEYLLEEKLNRKGR